MSILENGIDTTDTEQMNEYATCPECGEEKWVVSGPEEWCSHCGEWVDFSENYQMSAD